MTLSKTAHLRLTAQAAEARYQGLTRVAKNIDCQCEKNKARADDAEQPYDRETLKKDIEEAIWGAVSRVIDYFDFVPDARDCQEVAEGVGDDLLGRMQLLPGMESAVGAREPKVPGEIPQMITLVISEEEPMDDVEAVVEVEEIPDEGCGCSEKKSPKCGCDKKKKADAGWDDYDVVIPA